VTIVLQVDRSMLMALSSRQKNISRDPVTYNISHHGKKRGGSVSNTTNQNTRHSKQRRRGRGRRRGKGGKGKGKHRHNKSRSKVGDISSHHSHIRRNLEKQVLVQNRTLELLGGGGARILWASSGGNNTANGIWSDRNDSNSTKVLGDADVQQVSWDKSHSQDILSALSVKNNNISSDILVQITESTIKSHVPSFSLTVAAGIRNDESAAKYRGNATFKFPDHSGSAGHNSTRIINITAAADDGRAGSFAIPVRIGTDDVVMTDYQYDYDAIEAPGVVESSVWFSHRESINEDEMRGVSSASTSLEPGPVQAAVGTTLARVLDVLTGHGGSGDFNETNTEDDDPCERWMRCNDKLQKAFLGPLGTLPSCPCHYPSAIFYDDKIWDQGQGKYFR